MLTYVEFRSTSFPPYEGESDGINPGRFGRRLAEYLSGELRKREERVGELVPEDWGWVLPVENAGFDLWVGIGNYEEYDNGFLCFIEPHTDSVRKFFKKTPARDRVEELQKKIHAALEAHPDIRDVKWSSHDEFNAPNT